MYQNSNGKPYGGLGSYFGATSNEVKKVVVDPEAYIPKRKTRLDAYNAMRLVQRWNNTKMPPELGDSIYWKTIHGRSQPVFSTTGEVGLKHLWPAGKGRQKVKITPPPIKKKKLTAQVRDLPVVESLASGLGLFEEKQSKLAVLGLILLGLYIYNKKQSI